MLRTGIEDAGNISGRYTLSFGCKALELEPIERSIVIIVGERKRPFSARQMAPATDADIAKAEAMFELSYSDDYRAFLKRENGVDFHWLRNGEFDEHGRQYDAMFRAHSKDLKATPAHYVECAHGLPDMNPKRERVTPDMLRIMYGNLPFAYPVAKAWDFEKLLQVSTDEHRGKLLAVTKRNIYKLKPEQQTLEALLKAGHAHFLEMTFDEWLAETERVQADLYHKLYDVYARDLSEE